MILIQQAFTDSGRQLIGSFSAASNVTGILCDVNGISVMLHKHGALALWDYATAGPYVRLDMNPVVTGYVAYLVVFCFVLFGSGCGWYAQLFPGIQRFEGKVSNESIPVCAFLCVCVEISSYVPIPLFKPGSVLMAADQAEMTMLILAVYVNPVLSDLLWGRNPLSFRAGDYVWLL